MATKREIEIAKEALAAGFGSAVVRPNGSISRNDVDIVKLVDSLPIDLEAERREFDKWFNAVLIDASEAIQRNGMSWVFAGNARFSAWKAWKAARGIEYGI